MANLTATQKKQKKTFIALIVAIIVVAAAIVMVVFDVATAKSSLFENQSFAEAVSEIIGKRPGLISEKDLEDIKYLEINYNSDEKEYYVAAAKSDFVELYTDYIAKTDAGEENVTLDIAGKFKDSSFEMTDGEALTDLKYFKNLEVINISGVVLGDSAIFEDMKALTHANVTYAGLTEVNGFASLNADTVYEINLSGNDVADWSPLNYIEDKVIVSSTYTIEQTEDGSYTLVPAEQTLKELNSASDDDSDEEENSDAGVEEDGEEELDESFGVDAEDEAEAEAETEAETDAE